MPRIMISRHAFSSLLASSLALAVCACGPDDRVSAVACTQVPLHYHIAVDRSGSMAREWPTTLGSVETAIRHVPAGAQLHVYTFADDVERVGTWTVQGGSRDSLAREVRSRMGPAAGPQSQTHIYAMADTLAARMETERDARHVVFFVSDEQEDDPAYPDSERRRVDQRWRDLGPRIPSSIRVSAVRLGQWDTFRRIVPQARPTEVAEISTFGRVIAREIENDSFALQRQRERAEPQLSASLVSPPQRIPFSGGEVELAVTSSARCGVYHLADGTRVGPGETVILRRHVESPLSWADGFWGGASGPVAVSSVLDDGFLRPRVARYVPAPGAGSGDTTYAAGGHALRAAGGDLVFLPINGWLRRFLPIAALLVAALAAALRGLRPRGGTLWRTYKLDPATGTEDLYAARAGKEQELARLPGRPGIAVRLARVSPWSDPRKKVLAIRVVGEGAVGVARQDRETGEYHVDWLRAEETAQVSESAFILLGEAGAERPRTLKDGTPELYPGYEWKP
ncbi:vWA domain-containing protein [Longimicrobium sp.]|uniref:vWA domain-containing protein n=1 Tax=Longimicrobium sp. TaxID=2029185 RepID=UPI002E31A623|nr:vWA domain-containing protein [Longimicrobium sp.]HEX6040233.1 vWA domain-containing protein [Longimicrobium sp.]